MERYSVSQAMEGEKLDPVEEWVAPGVKPALKAKPMWQLGLGDGPRLYPERPGEPDCIYYLKSGVCGYGNRCRFNHPREPRTVMDNFRSGGVEYPERTGQPVCQYYLKTGTCKFGTTCKYHHPKHGADSSAPVTMNICGYPLRPTGHCKFGATCKFHHPQPSSMQLPVQDAVHGQLVGPAPVPAPALYSSLQPPSIQSYQQYGLIQGNWPIPRPAILPGSYAPGGYGPMLFSPGVVSVSGWTPYSAHLSSGSSPVSQHTIGAGPVYGITHLSPSAPAYTGPYMPISAGASSSSEKEPAFPERPDRPECQHYLRTGDCKFGPTCKYHHPPQWVSPKNNFMLSPMGLPLRPGARICSHYSRNGVCKFGPSCKFDHPMRALSYSSSTSSLTDMPVAPYPIGSINATLAPSSSSELCPGLNTEHFPPQMSSMSSSSASVGTILSRSGISPQLIIQGNIASDPGISSSTTSQGGEVQTSH